MAFPQDPLPIIGEVMKYDPATGTRGAWTGMTTGAVSDVRGAPGVGITRGRRGIQGNLPPSSADFTLNNQGGKYTNANPVSPNYLALPRYTPVRFRLNEPSIPTYALMSGTNAGDYYFSGGPVIAGDIDIRIDCEPFQWNTSQASGTYDSQATYMILMSKIGASTATNYSWMLALRGDGRLWFTWSPTGALAGALSAFSTEFEPIGPRMAFRVTMDVDNGASQRVISFYYSDSISGTWTLINTITTAGVTSISNTGGNLEIGSASFGKNIYVNTQTWGGRIYAAQLRNSIGGTIVSNPDFRALTPAVNEVFTDSVGNIWTPQGYAGLASDAIRFTGEVESWPQDWDSTARDCWVQVHAADQIQRLSDNSTNLMSPISQYLTGFGDKVVAWWPLEDGASATAASSNVAGSRPALCDFRFQAEDSLPGADGTAQMQGYGLMRGVPKNVRGTGTNSFIMWCKLTTVPSTDVQLFSLAMAGSSVVRWWSVRVRNNAFTVQTFQLDGLGGITNSLSNTGIDLTKWFAIGLELIDEPGGVQSYNIRWQQVGTSGAFGSYNSGTPGNVGKIAQITIAANALMNDVSVSHVAVIQQPLTFGADLSQVGNAYIGERAGDRFARLCKLGGVTPFLDGWYFETAKMGRQSVATLLDLVREVERVDGGVLAGTRHRLGLTYTTRARISGAYSSAVLSHAASHFIDPPRPVEDSSGIANSVTGTRPGGGSSTRVTYTGALGVTAIGVKPESDTFNVQTDDQLDSIVEWRAYLGTWEEARFPDVPVMLQRTQTRLGSSLAAQLLRVDVGYFFTIADLPSHQAPGPFDALTQGYSESLSNYDLSINYSTTPFGPWKGGVIGNDLALPRFQAADTAIFGVSSTETKLTFVTPGSTRSIRTSGTFEETTGAVSTYWVGTSCTLTQSSVQKWNGAFSMLMTVTGSPTQAIARPAIAYTATVVGGAPYRVNLFAYSPLATASFAVSIDWYDAVGAYIGTNSATTALPAAAWTYAQVIATAPANAVTATYGPTIFGSPVAGKLVYVDDIYVRNTSQPDSARWITTPENAGAFPMNVKIGGELMTVTAIGAQGEVQTATVTRSVNGIVKSHADGAGVQLANITTMGR